MKPPILLYFFSKTCRQRATFQQRAHRLGHVKLHDLKNQNKNKNNLNTLSISLQNDNQTRNVFFYRIDNVDLTAAQISQQTDHLHRTVFALDCEHVDCDASRLGLQRRLLIEHGVL